MEHLILQCMIVALLLPVIGAGLSYIFRDGAVIRNIVLIAVPAVLLGDVIYLRYVYYDAFGPSPLNFAHQVVLDAWRHGIKIMFSVEPMGMLFALLASMLWLPNMLYAIGYLNANHEHNQGRFFVMLSLSMAATLGVAFSGNLVTLLFFYELLTIFTYPLVVHSGSLNAVKNGRKYLLELMATSASALLLMIVLIYNLRGSGQFVSSGLLNREQLAQLGVPILILCSVGVAKAALLPLNGWLPAAMVAPTPVSAFLHAVAIVKAGVFVIIKIIVYVFGLENAQSVFNHTYSAVISGNVLGFIACATIVVATIQALRSVELKKILAYSTVANLSYIIGSASLFTGLGVTAALFQMIAHGCAKITLFFVAGSVYTVSHCTSYKEISGFARRMPITMTCFAISAASLIGIPFTAGYHGKMNIMLGTASSMNFMLMIVILISSVATVVYMSRILVTSYNNSGSNSYKISEAPFSMLCAMIMTTVATIVIYFIPYVFVVDYE